MKRAFFFMFLVLILYSMPIVIYSAASSTQPAKNKHSITARPIPDIKLDGELDKTVATEPAILNGPGSKKSRLFSSIYIGFDSMNIYVFTEVSGYTPGCNSLSGPRIRMGDCIEICFSTNPDADPKRKSFTGGDYWIGIKASENPEGWNWTTQSPLDRAQYIYKRTTNGYRLEALIPWYNINIGCICKIKNKPLIFNCAVDYSADKNRKISQVRWLGKPDFYKNPSEWGSIVFSVGP